MRILIQFAVLIALAGCAFLEQTDTKASENIDLISGTEGSLPESYQLHDVPHNPREQEGTDCGPDSLRMVLNYRGKNVARDSDIPRELDEINGLRGRGGGTTINQMMRISAESYGLPAFASSFV